MVETGSKHRATQVDALSKGFRRLGLQQKRTNQARVVEGEGDDDEDENEAAAAGVNVVLKRFPRKQRTTQRGMRYTVMQQRTIKTGISEQSIDHERADFLFKGFPGSIDHDVALKGISRKQQKESTNKLLKGF